MFIFLLGFWGYQQGEVFNINSNSYPTEEEKTEITVNVPNENYHYERNFKQEALLLKELMKKNRIWNFHSPIHSQKILIFRFWDNHLPENSPPERHKLTISLF